MEEEDYYRIMGLSRDATKVDIKRAYRELALKYHPDKHPNDKETAEQKFITITKAYNTLMDDEDRRKYDLYGKNGNGRRLTPYKRTGLDDLYDRFYSQDNVYSSKNTSASTSDYSYDSQTYSSPSHEFVARQRNHPSSVPSHHVVPEAPCYSKESTDDEDDYLSSLIGTIKVNVWLTLEEIYHGCTKIYQVARCRDGTIEHKKCIVTITPGFETGREIRAPGCGNKLIGQQADDIVFKVMEKPHPIFKRENNDIYQTVSVQLKDALLGFALQITDINGETISQNVQGPINPDDPIIIPGHGFFNADTNIKGNHIIHIKVVYPKQLTEEQRKAILTLF